MKRERGEMKIKTVCCQEKDGIDQINPGVQRGIGISICRKKERNRCSLRHCEEVLSRHRHCKNLTLRGKVKYKCLCLVQTFSHDAQSGTNNRKTNNVTPAKHRCYIILSDKAKIRCKGKGYTTPTGTK